VGEYLLAALHSESVKALAAQLQQLFAFGAAQLLAAHQT
jgi:flagellin-specific chaperone FliS